MKTKEELNALKAELADLNKRLAELTSEEMSQVTGGLIPAVPLSPADEGQPTVPHSDGLVDIYQNDWSVPSPVIGKRNT